MLDQIIKLKPSELAFDIRYEDVEGEEQAVGVFLHTLDDDHDAADNLGLHNVSGLPEYFGPEVSECYWCFPGLKLEQIRVDLEACGFTYVPLDSDEGEEDDDEDRAPIINRERCELAGHLDVDAGSIWIGDGCYVLKDKDEPRPADLGDDWHGICERFFTRSGYYDFEREFRNWHEYAWREVFQNSDEAKAIYDRLKAAPRNDDNSLSDEAKTIIKELVDAEHAFAEPWRKANPFTPTVRDKGFANFTHDMGHGGMGMMISTYYGDGSYPVYIEYDKHKGRPRRVIIDFDPGNWDDEED